VADGGVTCNSIEQIHYHRSKGSLIYETETNTGQALNHLSQIPTKIRLPQQSKPEKQSVHTTKRRRYDHLILYKLLRTIYFLKLLVLYRLFPFSNFKLMNTNNAMSIRIPEQELQPAKEALSICRTILAPYLQALSSSQRQTILKMSDKSRPFVAKAMDYLISDPKFVPPFMDLEEIHKDWMTLQELLPLIREMGQFYSNLNDTAMLAGSESYAAALSYYSSVKQAVKMNIPDAKVIYDDLSQRFEAQGRRKRTSDA